MIKNLIEEPIKSRGDKESDSGGDDKKPRKFIKTATDLQRLKLEKLMKNPDKPVIIPEQPKEKDYLQTVPSFVRNVMGSSAGAGSGEFHVYRHLRRKEYARQKTIQAKSMREQRDDEYQQKLENNRLAAEEKTAKKRAKRLKKKQRAKKPKLPQENQGDSTGRKDESSDDEEEDDEDDNKKEEVETLPMIDDDKVEEKDEGKAAGLNSAIITAIQEDNQPACSNEKESKENQDVSTVLDETDNIETNNKQQEDTNTTLKETQQGCLDIEKNKESQECIEGKDNKEATDNVVESVKDQDTAAEATKKTKKDIVTIQDISVETN